MCGILGIWAKNKKGEEEFEKLSSALTTISHRGPDNQGIKTHSKMCLGHVRLAIIDLDEKANQPMSDETGRYHLVFNGEIYNYRELRQNLELEGVRFDTQSDTEVLLHLLIRKGERALQMLNGFFSFIFYDQELEKAMFARDRAGIKPLLIYEDDSKIILTSEMHSLFKFDIDKTLDENPLNLYLRLTYMPAPTAILKNAYKILAGQMGTITEEGLLLKDYYSIKRQRQTNMSFVDTADELRSKLNIAVQDRLVSDVSLGCFLSGGVDSSIISAIAKRQKDDLQTFSIGFDHKYFNETEYSQLAASHIGTQHHEFIIGKSQFEEEFENFLDAIDEPFGDSSSFAMFLLAKETRKEVTVALSGDGADELFGGYRKQMAELRLRSMNRLQKSIVKSSASLLKGRKESRSDRLGDFNRKVQKLTRGLDLSNEKRYFEWCCFVEELDVHGILKKKWRTTPEWKGIEIHDMSDFLIADQHMVLANDMLKKVDLMSMAHSLEVRTPFLDHNVIEFANSIPHDYKLKKNAGKLVLKYAFKDHLPKEILHRKKRGFEIPIQEWLGARIAAMLDSEMFSQEFIEEQGIFEYKPLRKLIKQINSTTFGEKIYLIWSVVVFQYWYKKYIVE